MLNGAWVSCGSAAQRGTVRHALANVCIVSCAPNVTPGDEHTTCDYVASNGFDAPESSINYETLGQSS